MKEKRVELAMSYIVKLPIAQKKVMEVVIACYRKTDWTDLKSLKIFSLPAFTKQGYTTKTALKPFGSKEGYEKVIDELGDEIL